MAQAMQSTAGAADPQEPTEEQGIEDTGYFDVVAPYKKMLAEKLKDQLPESTHPYVEGAVNVAIPDNPVDLVGRLRAVGSTASNVISKLPNFPKLPSGTPIANKSIKSAFDITAEESSKLKKEAMDFLKQMGLPTSGGK